MTPESSRADSTWMAVITPQIPLRRSNEKVPCPPMGGWPRLAPDVLLDEGGERGLAHVVFPVDAGVDQHVDVARLPARIRGRSGRRRRPGAARLASATRDSSARWRLQCVCP